VLWSVWKEKEDSLEETEERLLSKEREEKSSWISDLTPPLERWVKDLDLSMVPRADFRRIFPLVRKVGGGVR